MTEERMVTIYVLRDPRYEEDAEAIRYVGQTATKIEYRRNRHVADALRGRKPCHRSNWICQLAATGHMPAIDAIVTVPLSKADDRERYFIEYYRSMGCQLTNIADGGSGATETDRRRMAERMRELWQDPEYREKVIRSSRVARQRPEVHAKQVSMGKAVWDGEERRKQHIDSLVEAWKRPETLRKRSEAYKAAWARPEVREHQRLSLIEALAKPEVRAAKSAMKKAQWQNPEFRAKMIDACRAARERKKTCLQQSGLAIV